MKNVKTLVSGIALLALAILLFATGEKEEFSRSSNHTIAVVVTTTPSR